MISFDYDKCVRCMKCVSVCPFTVLRVNDGKPELNTDKFCLKCMQGAAACPNGAVKFNDRPVRLWRSHHGLPVPRTSILRNGSS